MGVLSKCEDQRSINVDLGVVDEDVPQVWGEVDARQFSRDLLGFEVLYERPEKGFTFLALSDAHIVLDQADIGRT
ncbi:hypothetical protein CHUV2995_02135 [Corynebacterium diphtheriae subsp. lausannense]|uniref:hypothetical protein n=1 Tax=Corynebacterium belfantii TaxID=2014537 RepID=UPI000DC1CD21|nr:hypothetical protein [Corynebacterium belfantii]MBG9244127.1 hypothetical protein [Corynebacterium belfantii]MBG9349382.1 hypothetical protein [Corynebacterium belfantii]SPJ41321.1 hypothetical protein CHUV2995_02135 [Corynebacterium diphtheriae subsp. lausannense]